MLSKLAILDAIPDKKGSDIFKSVDLATSNTDILITKLKPTRKQYYSRISSLVKAGLVKRQNGRYLLTSFGMVNYDAQRLLGNAVKDYWKLKAIDSLGVPKNNDIILQQRY